MLSLSNSACNTGWPKITKIQRSILNGLRYIIFGEISLENVTSETVQRLENLLRVTV